MKKKLSKIQILRAVAQLAFFFVLPALVGLTFSQIKSLYVNIIHGTFSFTGILSNFVVLIAVLPVTIFLGRFFCGWICAFGALNDFVYAISQKVFKIKFKVNPKLDSILKYTKYIILVFIIVVLWTLGNTSFDNLSPWSSFGSITDFPDSIIDNVVGFIVLVGVVIGAFFIERFFCRYLCPLGAVLSLLSRFRLFNISKPSAKCGKCRICTNNCAMGIELYKTDKVTSGECINCFKCVDVCPRSNTQASICDEDINPTLASAAAITIFTGIYSITNMINGLVSDQNINKKYVTAQSNTDGRNQLTSDSKSSSSSQSNTTKSNNNAQPNSGNSSTSGSTTQNNSTSTSSDNAQAITAVTYKDGTYTGAARGYHPGLTVAVTVANGKISNVEITSHDESKGFYEKPFEVVPQEIIDTQSTTVDAVSGATRTSDGIMMAVANALQNAKA